jgi:hypothetical protein
VQGSVVLLQEFFLLVARFTQCLRANARSMILHTVTYTIIEIIDLVASVSSVSSEKHARTMKIYSLASLLDF